MEVEEGQAGVFVADLDERSGPGGDEEFERGADIGLEEMAAARFAGGEADDAVEMDLGFAGGEADVAHEGANFDLVIDGDVAEGLFLLVEPAEEGVAKTADGGDVRGLDVFLLGERGEAGHDLVAHGEDDGVGLFSIRARADELVLQAGRAGSGWRSRTGVAGRGRIGREEAGLGRREIAAGGETGADPAAAGKGNGVHGVFRERLGTREKS